MTNFLNRMAARALGAAPVAEPLLPARFSPAAGLVTGEAVSEMPAATSTVEGLADSLRRVASREPQRDVSLPKEESTDVNREPAARATTVAESVDSGLRPEKRAADASWDRQAVVRDTLPIFEPASLPMAISAAAHGTAPPSRQDAIDSLAETSIDADQSALADARLVRDEMRFEAPPRMSSAQTKLRSSVAATDGSGYFRRRDAAESAVEAPIIRVSIGRIDVRAQFPASTPPAPARNARPAAISLEEYLKQRREGKR